MAYKLQLIQFPTRALRSVHWSSTAVYNKLVCNQHCKKPLFCLCYASTLWLSFFESFGFCWVSGNYACSCSLFSDFSLPLSENLLETFRPIFSFALWFTFYFVACACCKSVLVVCWYFMHCPPEIMLFFLCSPILFKRFRLLCYHQVNQS